MKKQTSRRRIDVNVEELDRIIDGAMREPLNETDGQTLKTAVHAMAERLVRGRNTEKTSTVLGDQDSAAPTEETRAEASKDKPAGHGRNGASAYRGAEKVKVAHETLQSGHRCPDCGRGNVYEQKESKARLRWPPRSMNWKDCAAMPAGRSSRRRSRKA
jgi:Ni/Co efflux regulator RcnB